VLKSPKLTRRAESMISWEKPAAKRTWLRAFLWRSRRSRRKGRCPWPTGNSESPGISARQRYIQDMGGRPVRGRVYDGARNLGKRRAARRSLREERRAARSGRSV
jgi:hypothetical protein